MSDSESEDETVSTEPFSDTDMRLQQMQRSARSKGQSRFLNRLQDLKSLEEVNREQSIKRMREGLNHILSLHTAVELSSICGMLGLKVQQKPVNSMEQILDYAADDLDKPMKLLNLMWEGALFEYLRQIGHPVLTEFLDPKQTVISIWEKGGLLETKKAFTPHFVRREIKPRYQSIQAEDIRIRLGKLRILQERAKKAERGVILDHDYTNILVYFQSMSELRSTETTMRDYLVSELEISRSQVDSLQETLSIMKKNLFDCESQLVDISILLNSKLADSESLCERYARERVDLECYLQRLALVTSSCIEYQMDRSNPSCGSLQPLQFCDSFSASASVRELYFKLKALQEAMCHSDDALRERSSRQVEEIQRLEAYVRHLEFVRDSLFDKLAEETRRADANESALRFSIRRLIKLTENSRRQSDEAWRCAHRWAAKSLEHENNLKVVTPLAIAGIQHSNPIVAEICNVFVDHLSLSTPEIVAKIRGDLLDEVEHAEALKREALLEYKRSLSPNKKKKGVVNKKVVSAPKAAEKKKEESEAAIELTNSSELIERGKRAKSVDKDSERPESNSKKKTLTKKK